MNTLSQCSKGVHNLIYIYIKNKKTEEGGEENMNGSLFCLGVLLGSDLLLLTLGTGC